MRLLGTPASAITAPLLMNAFVIPAQSHRSDVAIHDKKWGSHARIAVWAPVPSPAWPSPGRRPALTPQHSDEHGKEYRAIDRHAHGQVAVQANSGEAGGVVPRHAAAQAPDLTQF